MAILNAVAPRIDVTSYRSDIVAVMSKLLKRKIELGETLLLKISLKPTFVTDRLLVKNPPGFKSPFLLQADEVEFGIDVIDFLLGKITVDRLIVKQAQLNLEQTEKRINNWTFGDVSKAQQHKHKSGSPVRLDYVVFDDVDIRFITPQQQKTLYINHALLKKNVRGRYKLNFSGKFNNEKLTFQASSNRWFDMRDIRPLHIKIDTDMAGNNLSASIIIQQFTPRVQASINITSRQINIDDLTKHFLLKTSANERPSKQNTIDDGLNKIDFLSIVFNVDSLRYKQREYRNFYFKSELAQDVFKQDDRFSVKISGKIAEVISPREKKILSISTHRGQVGFSLNSMGNTLQEIADKTRLSFYASGITGDVARAYNVKRITAKTDEDGRLQIKGDISYNNQSVKLIAQTGKTFLGDMKRQAMLHLDMTLMTNESTITINSTSRDIFNASARKIHLRISGDNFKAWELLAGRKLPAIGNFKLNSRLTLLTQGIKVKQYTFVTPASHIQGKLFYRYGKPVQLSVLIENSHLAMTDFRFDAVTNETSKDHDVSKIKRKVIPGTDLMKLLSIKMAVKLEVRTSDFIFNKFTIHDMGFRTRWEDKVLAMQIDKGQIADGDITADIYLTVVDEEAAGKIEMNLDQLDYGKLMQDLGFGDKMKGKANVNVHLVGFGKDLREFLTHSDGSVEIVGKQGILASKYLRLWGEDIVQQILPFNWFDREQTRINCVVGRFDLTDGRLSSDSLLLDTEGMTIAGSGAIDLGNEKLAFELMPDPKNISLISLATPVKIRGTLANPRIEPHALATTWTIGSLLLGVANPAILIARFAKLGSLGENPCLTAIGKKQGEAEETSLLKLFKDTVKFIQRPFDQLPDLE